MKRNFFNQGLLSTVLFLLFICAVSIAQHPDTVGIWLFDEGKGNTANDSSKRNHIAKAEGKVEWDQGKIGQAGKFEPGAYFVVDHTKTLNLSTFTITVWVKFFEDTGGGEQNIVHKQEGEDRSTRNYTVKMWEGTPFFIFASKGDGEALKLRGTSKITDGNWHHLAGSYDKTKGILYVDGKMEAEKNFTKEPSTNSADLRIGDGINGLVDEVQILSSALSAAEIRSVMKNGIQLTVQPLDKIATIWGRLKNAR